MKAPVTQNPQKCESGSKLNRQLHRSGVAKENGPPHHQQLERLRMVGAGRSQGFVKPLDPSLQPVQSVSCLSSVHDGIIALQAQITCVFDPI